MTQERLKELLTYSPETGVFTWNTSGPGRRRKEAGNFSNEYPRIAIDGVLYYSHRLAFLYMTGTIPAQVDHINGKASDCRWSNLRPLSQVDNAKNVKRRGYYKKKGSFVAQMTTDYKKRHLGTFKTQEEARMAYTMAKRSEHLAWATGQGALEAA